MLDPTETICAIASPSGEGLRGIVRISGPKTLMTLEQFTDPQSSFDMGLHRFAGITRASLKAFEVDLGKPLGKVAIRVSIWPDHRSYTGQQTAEIHTVGAGPILEAIVDRLLRCGARLAMPGEFTLRAFLSGKIDLVQAEAVLGVIEATHQQGLGVALDQLTGGISQPLRDLREEMLVLLADVEAGLDFVDEDIEFIDSDTLVQRLEGIGHAIKAIAGRMELRRRSSDLPTVVLWGLPNAGKSTLLNALCGRCQAIVSDVVGTTRDPVETTVEIQGKALRLIDTAGLEDYLQGESDGKNRSIAHQAQIQAQELWEKGDVRVWCMESTQTQREIPDWIRQDRSSMERVLFVATKGDQVGLGEIKDLKEAGWLVVSAASGVGIPELGLRFLELLDAQVPESETVSTTAIRCHASLNDAATRLIDAAIVAGLGQGDELVAAELRSAIDAVGEVTGQVYTDEILDRIFSRFCIGK